MLLMYIYIYIYMYLQAWYIPFVADQTLGESLLNFVTYLILFNNLVRKTTPLFAMSFVCIYKNEHFTMTGSGQT